MNATLQGQRSGNTPAQANGLGSLPPHKFQGLKARNNAAISLQIIDNSNSLHSVERIGRHDLFPAGERIDSLIKPTTLCHQIPALPSTEEELAKELKREILALAEAGAELETRNAE